MDVRLAVRPYLFSPPIIVNLTIRPFPLTPTHLISQS